MDLLCNPKLVGKIYKANKNIRLQSNGGKMLITHKAQVDSYKPHVWLYQKSITNLIYLKNIINQYPITYYSLDEILIFHQEEHGKHNMHFRMNYSSLHYYDPEDEELFLSTQLQETSKVRARYISRLLNRQGKCIHILVTHQLNTTSGS